MGDTIYPAYEFAGTIPEYEITEITIFKDEIVIVDDSDNEYNIDDFGKTIFLTREEAEAALKKL